MIRSILQSSPAAGYIGCTEAIRRLEVEDFPAIVVGDARGNDLYRAGRLKYRRA